MDKGIFSDREKAMEANYFRQQDAKLLERLRANASLDDIAAALADKLKVDNPDLLERVRALGITADTARALLLAPLVQVAWAEGSASKKEKQTVLRLVQERGVEQDSAAFAQINEWLTIRPPDTLFDTAYEVMQAGYAVLPHGEREDRIEQVMEACHKVAEASESQVAKLIGLESGVSEFESSLLDTIKRKLQSRS